MSRLLFILAFFLVSSAHAVASCSMVAESLFGLSLGQIKNYPSGLHKGIVREGTAEVIANVGFESLKGKSDGVFYPRIMVFYDRGKFVSLKAVGRVKRDKDSGFTKIINIVSDIANKPSDVLGDRATYKCEENIALVVQKVDWDNEPHVQISVSNLEAKTNM